MLNKLRVDWKVLMMYMHNSDTDYHEEVFQDLVSRYSESERHYHNLKHILAMLKELDDVSLDRTDFIELSFAIWFHDAVYDSRWKNNEELSAQLAHIVAHRLNMPPAFMTKVTGLIMATKHDVIPTNQLQQIIVDIDLTILGKEKTRFQKYEDDIRREYSWASPEEYRHGRLAVLTRFLDRPRIYMTAHFYKKYEHAARKNLVLAISGLG